mgnify:CR=1 FL=1
MHARKRLIAAGAALTASLLLAACGSDSGTSETGASGTYQAPAATTQATLTISNTAGSVCRAACSV